MRTVVFGLVNFLHELIAGRDAVIHIYVCVLWFTWHEKDIIHSEAEKKFAFSALTLLVGRQEGHPACKKTERWGVGVVICLELGADLHMAQLMPLPLTVSCFSKGQIGFTFLVPAHPGSPGKRAVKWYVSVCVRQKKGTNFLLCASLFVLDRNWWIFSYILTNI